MATLCEGCGRTNPQTYDRGPFKGSPMELDYCKYCSENLCSECMDNKVNCTESVDGFHAPASEDEGDEDLSEYPDEALLLHDPEE